MAGFLMAAPDSIPDHDIVGTSLTRPEWAIIREIDFRIDTTANGRELVFFYSRYKRLLRLSPPGNAGDFSSVLRAVCANGYVFDGGPSNPGQPFATLLSLNNHQVNNQPVLSYVIFKLAPGRWQFAKEGRPIKIGDVGNASGAYYEANRADQLGNPDPGNPGVIKDDCQVAFFISDGPKATAYGHYPHPFNLYVDLKVTGAEPMPLKIDPDIRFPGGSNEP